MVGRDGRVAAMSEMQPSRLTVRSVACVECGAEPGEPCHGRRGYRKANHATRVESYLAWQEVAAATAWVWSGRP